MRASFCYLPILPARGGAFRAVALLSPIAVSRIGLMFNVPAPVLKNGKTLDTYLSKRAQGIHECWGPHSPVYVDVHDLDPALRTGDGTEPIAFVLNQLRSRGSRAIPVTGTEASRGKSYLNAVRTLVIRSSEGVCLRLDRDDLDEVDRLSHNVTALLDAVAGEPANSDIVLDFRHVGRDKPEWLRASALDALAAIAEVGRFRNVAIAGSSVPEQLNKRDLGKVRRETRIELEVWSRVLEALIEPIPVALGDYGVIEVHHVPPSNIVTPPARSRYTTERDHVFRRAKRSDHQEICRQVVSSQDYLGETFSAGDRRMRMVAEGRAKPGAPANWVTDDTCHHLEFVSAQAWRILQAQGLNGLFDLAVPTPRPWLQAEMI